MAPRANWRGYLKLSLVPCAVSLFPATTGAAKRTPIERKKLKRAS
jgi:DNA end-binding protein Ku